MLDDFMVRAGLAGIGLALAAGPLGCFVVWRKMAYFGEATSHAAILGVALSLMFQVSIFAGALITAVLMAWLVNLLSERGYAVDTLLGVLAHASLAVGLVVVSFLSGVRIDLMAYLFGDILAVSHQDLLIIWVGSLLVLILLIWRWVPLLTVTLNEDLGYGSGFKPKREKLFITLSLGITVAVAIKVVGVLLIVAMLIMPAASARNLARTPETMAVAAAILGAVSSVLGLQAAYIFDTPAGPSIVCVASAFFLILNVAGSFKSFQAK